MINWLKKYNEVGKNIDLSNTFTCIMMSENRHTRVTHIKVHWKQIPVKYSLFLSSNEEITVLPTKLLLNSALWEGLVAHLL